MAAHREHQRLVVHGAQVQRIVLVEHGDDVDAFPLPRSKFGRRTCDRTLKVRAGIGVETQLPAPEQLLERLQRRVVVFEQLRREPRLRSAQERDQSSVLAI